MPTIAQLLTRPAGRVVLYGASGASISVDYRAHAGTPETLADILTDWDLINDETGVKIPPTPDGLQNVNTAIQELILEAIEAHAARRYEGSV